MEQSQKALQRLADLASRVEHGGAAVSADELRSIAAIVGTTKATPLRPAHAASSVPRATATRSKIAARGISAAGAGTLGSSSLKERLRTQDVGPRVRRAQPPKGHAHSPMGTAIGARWASLPSRSRLKALDFLAKRASRDGGTFDPFRAALSVLRGDSADAWCALSARAAAEVIRELVLQSMAHTRMDASALTCATMILQDLRRELRLGRAA